MKKIYFVLLSGIIAQALSGCIGGVRQPSTTSLENATFAYNTKGNGRLIRVNATCPLNGESFESTDWKSGSASALRLDGKRVGRFPQPIILPVCPGNKFVVYKKTFTDEEVEKLKKFISSPKYLSIRDKETDYYRLAAIYQYMGRESINIADAYLKATWQLREGDKRYKRYALKAIKHLKRALKEKAPVNFKNNNYRIQNTNYGYSFINMVIGELYRRSGMFNDAVKHLKKVKKDKYILEKLPDDMVFVNFLLNASKRKDASIYTTKDVKNSK